MALSPPPGAIADRIEAERRPPLPDLAAQQAYAEKHAARPGFSFSDESDVQIAIRARMLTRSDLLHEPVCTATRDRICALVIENQRLRRALKQAASTFRGYGALHRAKNTAEAEAKAVVNELLAEECEAALKASRGDRR